MPCYYRHAYAARTDLIEAKDTSAHLWLDIPEPSSFDELLTQACPKPPLHFFNGALWYLFFIYLRQYGFPSPLLDWTRSPDYAAFFAFDSPAKNAEYVSIYAMLRGYPPKSDLGMHHDITAPYENVLIRHFVQEAQYSLCFRWEFPCEFDEHIKAIEKTNGLSICELVRWDIPSRKRVAALKALDQKGANHLALFPASIDSLVRKIARRELLLKDQPRALEATRS